MDGVSCFMVSSIGAPITEPQVVDIRVRADGHLNEVWASAASIAQEVLEGLPRLWRDLIHRRYNLF